ncbi:MAG: dihydrolipoamide acetyltransferase family protein [Acidimicrobiia bacterium]
MGEFRMPSLGADMDEGRVVEWKVKPGDTVHRGDIVAVVDTDKADVEIEVFEEGVVDELVVPEGDTVPVGTVLARLRDGASAAPETAPVGQPEPPRPPPPTPSTAQSEPTPPVTAPTPPRAEAGARRAPSPVVRRLARHLGVDLDEVRGSGPGGTITRADVEAMSPRQPSDQRPVTEPADAAVTGSHDRAAKMRAAIGALMARSKREIPHYYLSQTMDLEATMQWLEARNAGRSVAERVLPAALLIKATALAVREVPELNGFFVDGAFQPSASVHVGVAISLRQGGLVAPALHDANTKDLDSLMQELRDLVNRARALTLRASEMADPTITVTNLGDAGVESVFGVIYPPQVALVGFGAVVERPWAQDGLVGAHRLVISTLSADHRVSDGHRGARFLATIGRLLKEPEQL